MPGKKVKFSRTEAAAKSDRVTKWELVAAIADDARDAGVPIAGAESVIAAKTALDNAGADYADNTVKKFCVLARFDHESDPSQRRVWRNYGCRTVLLVVEAGWSKERAAGFLRGERKSFREIEAAVRRSSGTRAGTEKAPFDERCAQWVQRFNKVLMDGAELEAEAEGIATFGAHAEMALMIIRGVRERQLDVELRHLQAQGL